MGVINLNDLANALKPVVLPGENLEVRIVKQGEEPGQGVGYLDDGTMIVVEGGRDHINKNVQDRGDQRAANQRRPHDLRPLRDRGRQSLTTSGCDPRPWVSAGVSHLLDDLNPQQFQPLLQASAPSGRTAAAGSYADVGRRP